MKSFQNFVTIAEAESREKPRSRVSGPEILPTPEGESSPPAEKPRKPRKKYQYGREGRVTARDVEVFATRQRTGGYGDEGATRGGKPGVGQTKTVATLTAGPYKGGTPISPESRRVLRRYAASSVVGDNPLRGVPGSGAELTQGQQRINKQILKKIERKYNIGDAGNIITQSPRTPAARDAFADMAKDANKGQTTLSGGPVPQERLQRGGQTPSQVVANTQQSRRIAQAKAEVPTITPGKTKPGTGLYTPPAKPAKTTAAAPATPATPAPAKSKSRPALLKPPTAKAPKVKTPTVKAPSGMKALARGASAFAAYTDFKGGREAALSQGGGNRRADAAGAFRAVGGFLGGGVGFAAGTPAGPVGQTVTGTLGYQKGAELGTKLFRRLTGKAGDKVTSQSVLKNLKSTYRDVVPQSIRKNVPGVAKKGFTDFYNQAVPYVNKAYKAYRRFNTVSNLTGGDNK